MYLKEISVIQSFCRVVTLCLTFLSLLPSSVQATDDAVLVPADSSQAIAYWLLPTIARSWPIGDSVGWYQSWAGPIAHSVTERGEGVSRMATPPFSVFGLWSNREQTGEAVELVGRHQAKCQASLGKKLFNLKGVISVETQVVGGTGVTHEYPWTIIKPGIIQLVVRSTNPQYTEAIGLRVRSAFLKYGAGLEKGTSRIFQ
jgi:hypothetical protein